MPQIMCPNCGMTINLENRREIDFNLIVSAAKNQPRTFTELLHITKLSRKTLSLRLKELCGNDVLVHRQRTYKLNGASELKGNGGDFMKRFSRAFHNQKIRGGFMVIAILLCSSVSGYALATFLNQPDQKTMIGTFMMSLDISNVEDLYAWQALITFNSSELEVMEFMSGNFLGLDYPFFLNATDIGEGRLLLGGTLCGSVSGKDGSGRLAAIVFGYFANQYKPPKIVSQVDFETQLWDSKGSMISNSAATLELAPIENP